MVAIKGVAAKQINSAPVPLIMVEHDASDHVTEAILVDHLPDGELAARYGVALDHLHSACVVELQDVHAQPRTIAALHRRFSSRDDPVESMDAPVERVEREWTEAPNVLAD